MGRPANPKAKKLAYDFIDITMRPEVQNILGERGGLPVAGDAATIKDAKPKEMTGTSPLSQGGRLGLLPGLAGPRLYDVLVSECRA